MITELLNSDEVKRQRDLLIQRLRGLANEKDQGEESAATGVVDASAQQLRAIADQLDKEKQHEAQSEAQSPSAATKAEGAFIPSSPLTCTMQSLLEDVYRKNDAVEPVANDSGLAAAHVVAAGEQLSVGANQLEGVSIGGFEDGEDVRYLTDGLTAVLGRLVTGKAHFNQSGAKPADLGEKARVMLFGDWATGIPRAQDLAKKIASELINNQNGSRQHLVHLGDTYYAGRKSEYQTRFLPYWPKTGSSVATHWSLNGNHDMYSGGEGYFQTLLTTEPFHTCHTGENGSPSSFFLLQNSHWQIFGLDSAYFSPQLTGMDGAIDPSQIAYIKKYFDKSKGVILFTHHQLFSARSGEGQSQIIRQNLIDCGVWPNVVAWIWGHEHRCTLYKPAWTQQTYGLSFAMCLGNSGVPTVIKNDPYNQDAVDWEYLDSLQLEGKPFMKFAYAALEFDPTTPQKVSFQVFGAEGGVAHQGSFERPGTVN